MPSPSSSSWQPQGSCHACMQWPASRDFTCFVECHVPTLWTHESHLLSQPHGPILKLSLSLGKLFVARVQVALHCAHSQPLVLLFTNTCHFFSPHLVGTNMDLARTHLLQCIPADEYRVVDVNPDRGNSIQHAASYPRACCAIPLPPPSVGHFCMRTYLDQGLLGWTERERERERGSAACAGAGGVEEIVLADVHKAIFKAFCWPTSQTRTGVHKRTHPHLSCSSGSQ